MKRTLQVVVEGTHKILTNPHVLERFLEAAIRENAAKAGITDEALYVEVHDVRQAGEATDERGFLKGDCPECHGTGASLDIRDSGALPCPACLGSGKAEVAG